MDVFCFDDEKPETGNDKVVYLSCVGTVVEEQVIDNDVIVWRQFFEATRDLFLSYFSKFFCCRPRISNPLPEEEDK